MKTRTKITINNNKCMKNVLACLWCLFVCVKVFGLDAKINGIHYTLNTEKKTAYVSDGENISSETTGDYIGDVVIPAKVTYDNVTYNVTSVASYAFAGCTELTSVTLPNSVTKINSYAFSNCSKLTSIKLGNKVTTIGQSAFRECSKLPSITLPSTVNEIGESAFYACSSIKSISIPDKVKEIKSSTFHHCTALETVTIPNGVTSIGESAFYYCGSLKSIVIPSGVTKIAKNTFFKCSSLASVTWLNDIIEIGDYAFYQCEALSDIVLPSGLVTIGTETFYKCDKMVKVSIGDKVKEIGDAAFTNCNSLSKIDVSENNQQFCSIDGVLFDKDVKTLICYPKGKTEKSYTIPNSVVTIGVYAFSNCYVLNEIVIPEGVTKISSCSFSECSGLESLTIPSTIKEIENWAMDWCWAMDKLVSLSLIPPTIYSSTFYKTDEMVPLYVPAECVGIYKESEYWKDFDIYPITENANAKSDIERDDISIRIVGGVLVVEGTDDYRVYDLMGKSLSKAERLEKGIYIVVTDSKREKVLVK